MKIENDDVVGQHLESHRLMYEATKDPQILWFSYGLCRRRQQIEPDFKLPEWILKEFDAIEERLLTVRQKPEIKGRHWSRNVAEVFGYTSRAGGPTDPFRAVNTDPRMYAMWVRILIDRDGLNETDACYITAERFGVARTTVRRAWRLFADAMRVEHLVMHVAIQAIFENKWAEQGRKFGKHRVR